MPATRSLSCGLWTAVLLATASCASSPDVMELNLSYRPTSQPDQGKLMGAAAIAPTTQIWVNPVVDQHPEGYRIGISQEEDNSPVHLGRAGLPPADFVRAALVQVLPAYGVPLTNDPGASTHVLEVRMTRFWTVEANLYQTWISGTVYLADKAGNVLWTSDITGFNKRWGRTFQAEPFLHTFSDAALDFGQNIALHPAFRQAAAGLAAPAPAAPPSEPYPPAAPPPPPPPGNGYQQ